MVSASGVPQKPQHVTHVVILNDRCVKSARPEPDDTVKIIGHAECDDGGRHRFRDGTSSRCYLWLCRGTNYTIDSALAGCPTIVFSLRVRRPLRLSFCFSAHFPMAVVRSLCSTPRSDCFFSATGGCHRSRPAWQLAGCHHSAGARTVRRLALVRRRMADRIASSEQATSGRYRFVWFSRHPPT